MSDHQVLPQRRLVWAAAMFTVWALPGCSLADDAPQRSSGLLRESSERTLLSSCVDGQLLAQPRSVDLTCQSPPISLVDLTWSTWGEDSAEASGFVSAVVECKAEKCDDMPQLVHVPVTMTARKVVDHEAVIDGKPLVRQYSQLDVQVTKDTSPGLPQRMTYDLPVVLSLNT